MRRSPMPHLRLACLPLVVWAALFTSCGTSAPSRFYIVNSPSAASAAQPSSSATAKVLVAIDVSDVPAHLQRDPIVTRGAGSMLEIAEFDRWAEPIAKALQRVLGESFEAQGAHIAMMGDASGADVVVRVELVALDGVLGESLEMRARWSAWFPHSERPRVSSRTVLREEARGDAPYEAWAAATARAFAALSAEITSTVLDADR